LKLDDVLAQLDHGKHAHSGGKKSRRSIHQQPSHGSSPAPNHHNSHLHQESKSATETFHSSGRSLQQISEAAEAGSASQLSVTQSPVHRLDTTAAIKVVLESALNESVKNKGTTSNIASPLNDSPRKDTEGFEIKTRMSVARRSKLTSKYTDSSFNPNLATTASKTLIASSPVGQFDSDTAVVEKTLTVLSPGKKRGSLKSRRQSFLKSSSKSRRQSSASKSGSDGRLAAATEENSLSSADIYLPTVRSTSSPPDSADMHSVPKLASRQGRRRVSSMESDETAVTYPDDSESWDDESGYLSNGDVEEDARFRAEEFIVDFINRKDQMKSRNCSLVKQARKESSILALDCLSTAMQTVDRIVGSKAAVFLMGQDYYRESKCEQHNVHNSINYRHWKTAPLSIQESANNSSFTGQKSSSVIAVPVNRTTSPTRSTDSGRPASSDNKKPTNSPIKSSGSPTGNKTASPSTFSPEPSPRLLMKGAVADEDIFSKEAAEPVSSDSAAESMTRTQDKNGLAIESLIDIRVRDLNESIQSQMAGLHSQYSDFAQQQQQVNCSLINPFLTAQRGNLHRIDTCIERVETIFAAVQILDEEINSLTQKYQGFIQETETKDSFMKYFMNEFITSLDNFQFHQTKQDRRLHELVQNVQSLQAEASNQGENKPAVAGERVCVPKYCAWWLCARLYNSSNNGTNVFAILV
jgi:hypothetical protein